MNHKIKELAHEARLLTGWPVGEVEYQRFAELIVKECADYVRETYDHEAAESIAWSMEVKYGLHGDYV